jgi:hypothetical protein
VAVTNPGFTVPLGRVKTGAGESVPLYISQEWQIFLQSLFERTGGSEVDRIDDLEVLTGLQGTLIDDAAGRATQVAIAVRLLRAEHAAKLKELEFLGAFSWA